MAAASQAVGHVRGLLERLGLLDKRLLLAVSGGADSMALAYLVGRAAGPEYCYSLTVDHGFRSESTREAKAVGKYMQSIGIRHEIRTLHWGSGSDTGNGVPLPPAQRLEEVARERRYSEIGSVCWQHGIHAVLTGHHAGDQAETFLFRFLRQSGIHGLAGMPLQAQLPRAASTSTAAAESRPRPLLVRPLLGLDKAMLYDVCKSRGIRWHEDLSNSDTKYKRNLLRKVIAEAGPDAESSPFNARSLLRVCDAMQGHREVLNQGVTGLLQEHARFSPDLGIVELRAPRRGSRLPPAWTHNAALRERLLASIIQWVNCKDHPPELAHIRCFEHAILESYGDGRSESAARPLVTAAGVAMVHAAAHHGWVFCRQYPRRDELPPQPDLPLGSAVLWDRRLVVGVRPRDEHPASSKVPGTWCIHSLHDAMQRWPDQVSEHRRALRKILRPAELLYAAQGALPAVSVGPLGSAESKLVYALGRPVAGSPATTSLEVAVRSLKGTSAADAFAGEVVA
ncbi:hypothetical protein GGF46_002954 [Coemansia sp. RSA 552]|nr:hypothetical protein GGF46_002954 [Coemansia sp. RSA 552]